MNQKKIVYHVSKLCVPYTFKIQPCVTNQKVLNIRQKKCLTNTPKKILDVSMGDH